jgi:hypothetical protein
VLAFGVFTILYRSAFASSARLQRAAPVCVT